MGEAAGAQDGRGWIGHALEQGGADPAVRARTLVARTNLDPAETAAEARETLEIAQRHGFGWLLGPAYRCSRIAPAAAGDLEEARRWADRERALPPEVADPSERTLLFLHATMVYLRLGRISDAHRFAGSTKRSQAASHRTTMSTPSGRRC